MIISLFPANCTDTAPTTVGTKENDPAEPTPAENGTVVDGPTTSVGPTVYDCPFTTTTLGCSEAEGLGTT